MVIRVFLKIKRLFIATQWAYSRQHQVALPPSQLIKLIARTALVIATTFRAANIFVSSHQRRCHRAGRDDKRFRTKARNKKAKINATAKLSMVSRITKPFDEPTPCHKKYATPNPTTARIGRGRSISKRVLKYQIARKAMAVRTTLITITNGSAGSAGFCLDPSVELDLGDLLLPLWIELISALFCFFGRLRKRSMPYLNWAKVS